MGKIKELIRETTRIHTMMEASKKVVASIEPIETSGIVLRNAPPEVSKKKFLTTDK